jgi:predicted ATPase
MRYTHFTITNFKGIKSIELDLDRLPSSPVFALVGLNESGKTTILEALDWLLSPNRYDAHQIIPKAQLLSFTGKISVEARLELSRNDEIEIMKHLSRKHKGFKVKSNLGEVAICRTFEYDNSTCINQCLDYHFSFMGQSRQMGESKDIAEGDSRWETVRKFIHESLLPPIIYYQNFLFDFPDKIYLEFRDSSKRPSVIPETQGVKGAVSARGAAENPSSKPSQGRHVVENQEYKEIIQDILWAIDPNYTIDKLLIRRFKSGKDHERNAIESVLNRMGSKVTNEVFTIWNDLLKIDEAAGMEVTFGDTLKEDEIGICLDVKIKEQTDSYFIRERSLGFRWFFAFFLFTHFRAYRYRDKAGALFLLDEPASNLHPSAQAKLLGVFEGFPYKQTIVYATHSHHMINPKWLAGTFVVKNSAKNYAEIGVNYTSSMTDIVAIPYYRFAASYPQDTDYFRPILDSLDYQPSHLELTPEIVLLEGRNDFYTLKFIKDSGYVETSIDAFLYPGTGKDKLDYIISLYVGWGRNLIVLLDDDKGGRGTYNRLMKDYGVVLENRLFRLCHVDNAFKGKCMEEVFVDPDPMKIIHETFPDAQGFDKPKFNTALQDCWINKKQPVLHKYTIGRFEKILKFLVQKLEENRVHDA